MNEIKRDKNEKSVKREFTIRKKQRRRRCVRQRNTEIDRETKIR